ncbi:probable E3 ubiquitin-protein ligase XERICO [Neltuma alba]|uniref:probable E3 ubiquitin-protein ligase XERICO n=1 Tax=Neltuma alba TaxID=207710 RepID=UPI0010A33C2B|nr:probable E3 ubiquitin-protein ligase XERICO [Prosopis alba]
MLLQNLPSPQVQERITMGLSNFPSAAEGLLPVLVMNTLVSVATLKNLFRYLLRAVAWNSEDMNVQEELGDEDDEQSCVARRRVSIMQYKCMVSDGGRRSAMAECCVCLCRFQGSEEVSELSCKHFFHTACLDKWFLKRHDTCPLCRSTC